MKQKTVYTESGKEIHIFDELYDFRERTFFYNFMIKSLYRFNISDTSLLENRGEYGLYSDYSVDDVNRIEILTSEHAKPLLPYLAGMSIKQARINLSTLYDKNRFHLDTDSAKKAVTFLYYANLNWDIESSGHTLFSNEDKTEIEHCIMYKPGRVVIFDGKIPHCILSPNTVSPAYRLSFAIQFAED
jgi:hypothetical protein